MSRAAPSTVASTVTNCTDDNVAGTLRNAVVAAANNEVIDVSACSSITLTRGEIASFSSVTIAGPSSGATTTIDANHASRVFELTGNAAYGYLTLSGLTVTGGHVVGNGSPATGGCILGEHVALHRTVVTGCIATTDNSSAYGGAIQASFVTMEDSRIEKSGAYTHASGNQAKGGAVFSLKEFHCVSSTVSGNTSYAPPGNSADGGGVSAFRIATLDGCTIDSNSARNSAGIQHIGFDNTQTMTITNSTVSGNTATNNFGGIYSGQLLTITNSTITNNRAVYCGGAFVAASADVNSSIIAGNVSDNSQCVDLLAQAPVTGAHNLVSVANGTFAGGHDRGESLAHVACRPRRADAHPWAVARQSGDRRGQQRPQPGY